jgi:acyl-coenzyme A thioesterase PaaI-like protein
MQKASSLKTLRAINFYPPILFSGIRVIDIADDYSSCTVRLKLRWWNRNAVGVLFGGSLYAMCDPFFMLLLMRTLSVKEYIIWDKAATIRFRKPGKSTVYAHFHIPLEKVESMRQEVEIAGGKKDFDFYVEVVDEEKNVIAEVEKVIYVRKKK